MACRSISPLLSGIPKSLKVLGWYDSHIFISSGAGDFRAVVGSRIAITSSNSSALYFYYILMINHTDHARLLTATSARPLVSQRALCLDPAGSGQHCMAHTDKHCPSPGSPKVLSLFKVVTRAVSPWRPVPCFWVTPSPCTATVAPSRVTSVLRGGSALCLSAQGVGGGKGGDGHRCNGVALLRPS